MGKRELKCIPVIFIGLFFFNFLFQAVLLRSWNEEHLMAIAPVGTAMNFPAILLDYLMLSVVLAYLLSALNKGNDPKRAGIIGAVTGGVVFLHFGLLSYLLIPQYPVPLLITDTLSSVVAFALVGMCASYVWKKFLR